MDIPDSFVKNFRMTKLLDADETLTLKAGPASNKEIKRVNDVFYNPVDKKLYNTAVVSRTNLTTLSKLLIDFRLQISDGESFCNVANLDGTFNLVNFSRVAFNYSYVDAKNNLKNKKIIKKNMNPGAYTCNKELFGVDDNVTYGYCSVEIPSKLRVVQFLPSTIISVAYSDPVPL